MRGERGRLALHRMAPSFTTLCRFDWRTEIPMIHDDSIVDFVAQAETRHVESWHRRKFMKSLAGVAGSVALLGYDMTPAGAEPPPEVTRLRLLFDPAICLAPEYAAEELLRAEGFRDVQYVKLDRPPVGRSLVGTGVVDITGIAVGESHYLCRFGRSDSGSSRVAPRLLRAVRIRTGAGHSRSEG
jgi:hypothetical protein